MDAKDIARQAGFDTHTELANYMKNKGYHWDSRQGNYVEEEAETVQTKEEITAQISTDISMNELLKNIMPLLRNMQITEKIIDISEATPVLPRYQLKGMYGTKAVRMANMVSG
ncbi:MAG: hypothetical protein FNP40_08255 [Dehalobacter sp. 4CP]|uniref:hypothetical protein n=1 Tax=Dehalobacter sp. CP TaxID=2594474 RepID=UPI0013C7E142|nr:hypothetical protein [Dehalobacter sp. 4CP]